MVQPIVKVLRDATWRGAFSLISQTYTSIVITCYFATFVGLPVEEAVKGILEKDGRLIPIQSSVKLFSLDTHYVSKNKEHLL